MLKCVWLSTPDQRGMENSADNRLIPGGQSDQAGPNLPAPEPGKVSISWNSLQQQKLHLFISELCK